MTAVEMGQWFDLIQDKFNAPYFNDTEKSLYLTRAQENLVLSSVSNIINPDPDFENTEQDVEKVQSLIYDDLSVASVVTGIVTTASIITALNIRTGGADTIIRIISVKDSSGRPIMYIRHNDEPRMETNVFKQSDNSKIKRKSIAEGIRLIPNAIHTISVTVVKTPLDIDIATAKNSELPKLTHNKIVAKALQLASVTTQDEALLLIDKIS